MKDEKFGEISFWDIHTDGVLGNSHVVTSFCFPKYLHDFLFYICVINERLDYTILSTITSSKVSKIICISYYLY